MLSADLLVCSGCRSQLGAIILLAAAATNQAALVYQCAKFIDKPAPHDRNSCHVLIEPTKQDSQIASIGTGISEYFPKYV